MTLFAPEEEHVFQLIAQVLCNFINILPRSQKTLRSCPMAYLKHLSKSFGKKSFNFSQIMSLRYFAKAPTKFLRAIKNIIFFITPDLRMLCLLVIAT